MAVFAGDADFVGKPRVGVLAREAGGVGTAAVSDSFDGAVAGLGHAEADDDAGAEAVLEVFQKLGVEGWGAVKEADGVLGIGGGRSLLGEDGHHHADEVNHGGAGVPNLVPESGGAESVGDDQSCTGGEGSHGGVVLGVGVEVGETGEEPVFASGLGPVGEPLAGGDVHLVGDLDALGVAGGAGGVLEHGNVDGGDAGEAGRGMGLVKEVVEAGPTGGNGVWGGRGIGGRGVAT